MHHNSFRAMLEQQGVPEIGNPAILFTLRKHGENPPMTQREIADELGIAPPTVAVSIKRMEKAGLVCKKTDRQDLRKNYILLTDAGIAHIDTCTAAEQRVSLQAVSGFSAEETELLRGFYMRMIENLHVLAGRYPGEYGPHCKGAAPIHNENEE